MPIPFRLALIAVTLASTVSPSFASGADSAAWIAASNVNTDQVLVAQAKFMPETSFHNGLVGLAAFDGMSVDLGPDNVERYSAAMRAQRADMQRRLIGEKDPRVRQDLDIIITALDKEVEGAALNSKYSLPWVDVPKLMFGGMHDLLQAQLPEARRAKALERLRRYTGLFPGTTALTGQAESRFMEKSGEAALQGPVRALVEQSLTSVPTYIKGIRNLFAAMHIADAEPALAAMEQQLTDYAAWERAQVLPRARADFHMAPALYAFRLRSAGVDITPEELIERAGVEYVETRAALQALAPVVAAGKGMTATGYRAVIAALKKNTIPNDQIESFYKNVNTTLEATIRRVHFADIPDRAMTMRLASDAESAAEPAPHMAPPRLVGNTGEHGVFVLPLSNPAAAPGATAEPYDDFNFPSAAWTVSAHEGRPGHDLQVTAMVERGVSEARAVFAFNNVNIEGWALYSEMAMLPYEPVDGQMIALQMRMMRAARAMLDPMLNLGLITRAEAGRVLGDEVMLSAPMVRQELDRYTLRMPGQAGSYFYGYMRILQLRAETELALGAKFDALAFHNFLIGQGLLPPDLMAKAVRTEFIPAQLVVAGAKGAGG